MSWQCSNVTASSSRSPPYGPDGSSGPASLWLGEQVADGRWLPVRRNERLQSRFRRGHPLLLPGEELVEPPSVRVRHDGSRDQGAVLEVLVALRLAPSVTRHHVVGVEEDVPRVGVVRGVRRPVHGHTAFGLPSTGWEASRWVRMKVRRSPTVV